MLLSICLGSPFIVLEHHEVGAVSTVNMDISGGLEINNCRVHTALQSTHVQANLRYVLKYHVEEDLELLMRYSVECSVSIACDSTDLVRTHTVLRCSPEVAVAETGASRKTT